ncbi:glycosyltransferase [Pseudodesulfovibrio piezophilus]|uniref:Glycosyl transferase group 1 n=1 Tax=Pseudodesulfovibrio piezophilus (strain DSM 21447 / JCM 15486 / C1TLV30) TaxID=1322246 RepID=M1WKC8_PSEP2|nr:glycosyltransferase [Pseudodesulfovibrio piezophilus]CCH49376.1 Glycosyl transferase group 1 [Pseudodesulfovibrio piezophilus C1TLV30]
MIRTSIPVFCYHNVSDIDGHTPERFCEHLDAIQDAGYRTLSSRDLMAVVRGEKKAPPKSVVLTFDDGHLSNWLNVLPELLKRDMTGTFFLLTDFTRPGSVRTLADAPPMTTMPEALKAALQKEDYAQFINESEAKAMVDKGMEIFSHGCRHQGIFRTLRPTALMGEKHARWPAWSIYPGYNPQWPTFDDASAYVYDGFTPQLNCTDSPRFVRRSPAERLAFCRKDFARSIERMRELNGLEEQLFCWPWGHFCDDAEAELKKAGYAGAFTLERWVNAKGTDPFRLNRIGVGRPKTGKWIQARLRMYGSDPAARFFFKLHTKRPEVQNVLYATDSTRLSGGSRQMINNIEIMTSMGITTHALLHPQSPLIPALDGLDVNIIPYDNFSSYLSAGRFMKKTIRENSIDVVHTFHNRAYKMGVIAKLMGAKFKLFINRGVISRPNDIFFLWTALSNGVICNSVQCAKILKKHRVMKRRLNVVYNAYCGPDFGERKPQKKRGTRFIYVGNVAEIKGYDIFAKAASRLCETSDCRNLEFVAVGITAQGQKRFAPLYTPALKERLTIHEELSHMDTLEEMRFADVICVTSRLESFPNTLIEGFDLGLPGICTAVGGIPEIIRDGVNGFLCASEDVECLAQKMRLLADDPITRYTMGKRGRAVVRTLLTPEEKGHNLMRVYMGEQRSEPLAVDTLADTDQPDEKPYAECKD